jgi:hypothetical protein
MSHQKPQRIVSGSCPTCGASRIDVLLEGNSYFIGLSTPNWWCTVWHGRCCNCHAYLETFFDDEQEAEKLDWTRMDDEVIDFLFGQSAPEQTDTQKHRPSDSELGD